jgi:hypothetical protein
LVERLPERRLRDLKGAGHPRRHPAPQVVQDLAQADFDLGVIVPLALFAMSDHLDSSP